MKPRISTQPRRPGIGFGLIACLVLTAFVSPSALAGHHLAGEAEAAAESKEGNVDHSEKSTEAVLESESGADAGSVEPTEDARKAVTPETDDEKVLYFIGVVMSGQPGFSSLRAEEVGLVTQGLQDALAGNAVELDAAEYGPKMQLFFQERVEEQVAKEKKASEAYLAKMTAKEGAEKTDSGLIYFETESGKGASPKATDTVKVHYHGTLANGTVFDSSMDRGEPAEFPLNRVIPCWTEGVAKMKPGGKATLICPADIAYGDRGAPPSIPGGATLSFDVQLLTVLPAP